MEGFKVQSVRPHNSDIQKVADVIEIGKGWNIQKLAAVTSPLKLKAIKDIPLPILKRGDRLEWHHSRNGVYSVKSGYHLASKKQASNIPSKPGPPFNPMSNFGRLFGSSKCQINSGTSDSTIKWTTNILESMPKTEAMDFLSKVTFITWNIWKGRNDFVFRNERVNPTIVMARANFAQLEFSSTCVTRSVPMDNQPIADVPFGWVASDVSKIKVNCDVVFKERDTNNTVAVVMHDHAREHVQGRVKTSKISSALHGELVVIPEACLMVSTLK
ncbi:hypothetical protein RHGRI_007781 [Rhododendron griersonianum]|uniref:Uncharacterized protein n=2 Tax=Rhododendron griersonianum TaxID=479676 RepID=A0AAV6KZF5_9ERIC|nr:hypothetical protein RHGRI_007781 [Rhododendron griersonianum]